jgi:hypothetical protein
MAELFGPRAIFLVMVVMVGIALSLLPLIRTSPGPPEADHPLPKGEGNSFPSPVGEEWTRIERPRG